MVMVGCHSAPTTITPAAVTITLGTVPSSLTVGQTFQFAATVANSTNAAVTWSVAGVTGGNSTAGTISSAGMYTAPAMMPSPASVTIMATSQADTTKSASISVAINVSLALNMTSTSLQVSGTQQFTATILGTTNTDVTWTVNGVAGGNSSVGTISNAGLYTAPEYPPSPNTVTVTAISAAETSMSESSKVTVKPPPISIAVNPAALDLQVGRPVQFSNLVRTTSSLPISTAVTWGAESPGATGNAVTGTISPTGEFTAPTRVPAFNPVKVYVVSQEDSSKFAVALVTVTTAPVPLQVSTTTLADGVVNTPYTATISAFGGAQPYAWTTAGPLPAGLALNASTGVVSGTPTTAGTFPFSVTVTDQTSPTPETANATLSITIIPQLSISTTALPSGSVSASYSSTLAATGGVTPYTWSITSGSLPSGLTLNPATGAITGTPAAGTGSTTGQPYPLTFRVTDSGTPQQTKTFSTTLTIYIGVVITTTSPINTAFVGQPYNFTVQAVGGVAPYTWLYTNLPSWLSVATSTGLTSTISGTPTAPAAAATFTAQITDANGVQKSVNLNITVSTVLTFPAVTLPNGVVSTAYSTSLLAASGGTTPYTYSLVSGAGSLPAGLTLSPSSGAISGTPTTAGASNFSVKVADSSVPPQTHTQALGITISSVLTITTTSLPTGTVNSSYSAGLSSRGGTGTISWTLASGSSLPSGLHLSASGTLSGTPATAGTTSFTVGATDSGTPPQTKNQLLSMTVNPVLTITTTTLPNGTVGTSYSQNVQTSGGTLPITWRVPANTLPPGLAVQGSSSSYGTITGTPTASSPNPYSFTITATDSSIPPVAVNQALSITINNLPLTITTTTLPSGTIGVTYAGAQLNASGGTGPYTWGFFGTGTFPPCFYLSPSGSIISGAAGGSAGPIGNPCTATTYTFGVKVTDSATPVPNSQTATLSITINPAVALACTDSGSESLLSGQYAFTLSGYNPTGFLAVVGSFTADGTGKITAGEVDSDGALGVRSKISINTSQSSYSVGSNHLGCAMIVTSFGTFDTRLSIGGITSNVATQGRLLEWDSLGSSTYFAATGQLLKQTAPAAPLSGTYVVASSGTDGVGVRKAVAGVISASSGSLTGGEMDVNDGGTASTITGLAGAYTSSDLHGRYTFTYSTPSEMAGVTTVGYIVSGSEALVTSGAASGNVSPAVGEMRLQTPPEGGFGPGSVNGNVVLYMTGLNGGGTGGSASFALATFSPTTQSVAGTNYYNGGGTWQTPTPGTIACSYSVATNGRMTLTGCGSGAPVFYLTATNTAVTMTMDADVAVGAVVPQVVPTGGFSSSSVSGNYYFGDEDVTGFGAASNGQLGVTVLSMSSGSGTLIQDITSSTNGQQADQARSIASITVNSNGTFSTNLNGDINAELISATEFVIISNSGSTYPTVEVGRQ